MKKLEQKHDWPTLAVYDIETSDWVNVELICHMDEYGNKVHFRTVGAYLDWLNEDFEGEILWAHAGGRFDHRFLIPVLKERGWGFSVAMSGGTIVLLRVHLPNKVLKFGDSYRLMPNALKSIGKTVGLAKLDVDRGHIELLSEAEQLEYCYRDCEIVLKGLQLMRGALTAVDADFAFTLASIASRWVRRAPGIHWPAFEKEEKRKIAPTKRKKYYDAWCTPAYFGGRTEMFQRGTIKGPIYYYDIVSSYPSSMRNELPLYFKDYIDAPLKRDEQTLRSYLSHPGITECWVSLPRAKVTPLCVKYLNRLVFPYGHRFGRMEKKGFPAKCTCGEAVKRHRCSACGKTFPKSEWMAGRWTNIELLAALDRGARILPICQARFEGVAFLNNFVNTFYSLRKQAKAEDDAFRTYAYKILLNSLYGKLVETIDRESYVTIEKDLEEYRAKNASVTHTATDGVWCVKQQTEGPFRHVAAGSYVTAYSRLRLLQGLEAALVKGGEIYYCDTDSIMTNVRLDELQGKELGQWQLEHIFDEVEILLPKVYRARIAETGKMIYRCKGVPMVREGDTDAISQARWEAFKAGDDSQRELLGKEGVTGFKADINNGDLNPRKTTLLRCLREGDRKREWRGNDSWPLEIRSAI
jgi:hypothetical protein